MKILTFVFFSGSIALSSAFSATDTFDDARSGQTPSGWTATMTGQGAPEWTVIEDTSAPSAPNVLKQSGTAAYPLCLREGVQIRDGFVEVKGKALEGEKDQAIGVVWRARDKDNYYVCRANALEDNVVLYKMEGAKRSSLDIVGRKGGYGVDEEIAPQKWHTLRVEFNGPRFRVFLNGKHLFDVDDTTFTEAGTVGLWTKADSVTVFDDFSYDTE